MGLAGTDCWVNSQFRLRHCFVEMEEMGILGVCCLRRGYFCRQSLRRNWSWLCLGRIAGRGHPLWSVTHRQGNQGMVPVGLKPKPKRLVELVRGAAFSAYRRFQPFAVATGRRLARVLKANWTGPGLA